MSRDWPRLVATGAFAVVSAVAAAISYDHIMRAAGPHWFAPLLPLSVDGLMVAGSIALFLERASGRRGSVLAWSATLLGLAASLAANVAAADPGVQGVLVAAWPPVALALAFELLIRVRRREPVPQSEPLPEPVVEAPPVEPRTVADVVAETSPAAWSFDDAVAWAAREGAGAKRIQAHTGLSEYKAKQAAKQAKEPPGLRVAR